MHGGFGYLFAPTPASIGISIPRCYPQCPIRLDPAPLRWPEARTPPPPHPHPAHRDTSILVARTLQRSTSNLGPSRYPSSRLRRPSPITPMSAILPVPRGPAMPTALNRESLCQGMDGGSTITRPDARRERSRGNRRRIRAPMNGCPRLSSLYRNGCTPNVSWQRQEPGASGIAGRNGRCGR